MSEALSTSQKESLGPLTSSTFGCHLSRIGVFRETLCCLALEVLPGAFCPHLVQEVFWSKFRVFQETTVCVVSCVSVLNVIWVRAGPQGCSITKLC